MKVTVKRFLVLVIVSILAVSPIIGCGGVRSYIDPEKRKGRNFIQSGSFSLKTADCSVNRGRRRIETVLEYIIWLRVIEKTAQDTFPGF